MGIPLYFKTLSSKFPETIISDLNKILKVSTKKNHLFFDLNCAIHPCCRNILKEHNSTKVKDSVLEKRMLTEIISYMKKIWQKIIFYCLLTLCIVVCSSVKKTKLFWTLHFENFLDTLTKKSAAPCFY